MLALAVAAFGVFVSRDAQAYNYQTCGGKPIKWNRGWAELYISTTSMPIGGGWDNALQRAMWHWNNVKGSSFLFYVARDADGNHVDGHGVTEVYWDATMVGLLAVTSVRYHCYWENGYQFGIDETDLGFNANYSWTSGAYNYATPNGAPYSFEGVALHELGHVIGLDHEDRWMATLNSYYPNSGPLGSTREWDPFGDDRLGARALYSDGTTEVDIAGSVLKRTGAGRSNPVSSPPWAVRGSNTTMEFTFLNQSSSTRRFDIGFYLSTNDVISTGDTLLGTSYAASGTAGFTGTFSRTLCIPTWIAPGTYYLGFIVDPLNTLGENNESNNTQRIPRTIRSTKRLNWCDLSWPGATGYLDLVRVKLWETSDDRP